MKYKKSEKKPRYIHTNGIQIIVDGFSLYKPDTSTEYPVVSYH